LYCKICHFITRDYYKKHDIKESSLARLLLFFIHLKTNLILPTVRMTPLTKYLCVFCITRDECKLCASKYAMTARKKLSETICVKTIGKQTKELRFNRNAAGLYITNIKLYMHNLNKPFMRNFFLSMNILFKLFLLFVTDI